MIPIMNYYHGSWYAQMNLIFVEKHFKEEYCTISVLHGTVVSKNWTVQENNIVV